jgi:hypothetical protein
MTKTKIAAAITLLAASCAVFCLTRGFSNVPMDAKGALQHSSATVDKMFPDGLVHHFGKVVRGAPCRHSFRLVNAFDVPLCIVSVRSS